jgi:hypothetical protein
MVPLSWVLGRTSADRRALATVTAAGRSRTSGFADESDSSKNSSFAIFLSLNMIQKFTSRHIYLKTNEAIFFQQFFR